MAALIVRADIEAVIGSANTNKWADLNNNGDPDEIAARITYAIELASDYVLSKARLLTYDVTLFSTDRQLKHAVALRAADILYGPRRVDDADLDKDMMRSYRKEFSDWIKEVASGRLDLGYKRGCRPYPAVVRDDCDGDTQLPDGVVAIWRDEEA